MRIRLAVPSGLNRDETAGALDAALEAVTRGNVADLVRGRIPTFLAALKAGRVRWKPEPPGSGEAFDHPSTVLRRGWGDCDDLAPWYAASLRATGADPEARAIVRPSGPNRWHAVVERHDGRIQDPSKAAGMGQREGARPAAWPAMFGGSRPSLALAASPLLNGWAGRVDVADPNAPWWYSAATMARTPAAAVVGAIDGAMGCAGELLGDELDPITAARAGALADLLAGALPSEVDAALEQDGMIGFLPALLPAATSLAAPMLSKLMPGGGGKGGGAPAAPGPASATAPGTTMTCPGGPIIVRF